MPAKPGLYSNIHKKRARIRRQKAAGKKPERMRKPGTKGAPTAAAFKAAAKTAKGRKRRR
jgi:cysteine sulfinate desulfinase/cysteine desulfurase-like protein